jgi:hypothetical protein
VGDLFNLETRRTRGAGLRTPRDHETVRDLSLRGSRKHSTFLSVKSGHAHVRHAPAAELCHAAPSTLSRLRAETESLLARAATPTSDMRVDMQCSCRPR